MRGNRYIPPETVGELLGLIASCALMLAFGIFFIKDGLASNRRDMAIFGTLFSFFALGFQSHGIWHFARIRSGKLPKRAVLEAQISTPALVQLSPSLASGLLLIVCSPLFLAVIKQPKFWPLLGLPGLGLIYVLARAHFGRK